jgi:four helix bundle protein
MLEISSVEDLDVFKKAHALTLDLYKMTQSFPVQEQYNLISQIRRSASSICSNLLEGSHRTNTKEFRQFAGIANGSSGELKYHILLSKDLGYINEEKFISLRKDIDDICKMLRGLIRSLSRSSNV